jgi:hypothetical protein
MPPGLQLIDRRRWFGDVVALDIVPTKLVVFVSFLISIGASLVIVVGSTALLIPLAGRVYAGAILRTFAKVRIRDAWRAAA